MRLRLRRLVPVLMAMTCVLAGVARAQSLYWLDTSFGAPTLNQADADGNAVQGIALSPGTLPEGLALDDGGRLYWTEAVWIGARIQRAGPTLGSLVTLVSGGSALRGIAVDATAGYLYWSSSDLVTGPGIHRAVLNGSGATMLVALGPAANPRGVAVDHAGGKLYWADFAQDAIYRANLDGSSVEVWQVLHAKARPYGVAFDALGQYLYWTEYTGRIRRAPVAGGAMTTLLSGLPNPTYLALDPAGDRMYWSEGGVGAQHIARASMTGAGRVTLSLPLATYGGLAFNPSASVSAPVAGPPLAFALAPPSPNPSRGPVQLEFALPRESHVRLSVLDLQGREVAVLADHVFPAGRHRLSWNDGPRRAVRSGMYFIRIDAEGRTWTRRLVLTH